MPDDNPQIVIGCRWVSEPGDCKICSALDGKEFYKFPREGQLSLNDMPPRRPHPNCRCHIEYIYEPEPVMEGRPYDGPKYDEWGQEIPETPEERLERWKRDYPTMYAANPKLFENAEEGPFGLLFFSNGRGLFDGPAYGNYGGKRWTDGQKSDDYDGSLYAYDNIDQACKTHDEAYNKCEKASDDPISCRYIADKRLIADLEEAPVTRENFNFPDKTDGEMEYAEYFRSAALFAFKVRVAAHESRIQEKEQGSITAGGD